MGNGVSSNDKEVAHLIERWEIAATELSDLCRDHRRQLSVVSDSGSRPGSQQSGARPYEPQLGTSGKEGKEEEEIRRRASSLVSFNRVGTVQQHSRTIDGVHVEIGSANNENSMRRGEKSPQTKPARKRVQESKKARNDLFNTFHSEEDDMHHLLACGHFGAVAAALSYMLGGGRDADRKLRVTVEDLFFSAQIPLRCLHEHSMPLTELCDHIREFVDVDNRFKGRFNVDIIHLDIAPAVGQVEIGGYLTGDRQTKLLLTDFRKIIQSEFEDDSESTRCIRIVQFDPWVLEQATIVEDEDGEELSGGEELLMANSFCPSMILTPKSHRSGTSKGRLRAPRENEGRYAVVTDFRQGVQPMVTLAYGYVNEKVHLEMEEVPLPALYKAMIDSRAGRRSKGFVRISARQSAPIDLDATANQHEDPSSMFSPELVSGKVLGNLLEGTHAVGISSLISPHIIGFGWALHLLGGQREGTHGYGKGLPVSDIIRQLQLPIDVFLQCDLPLDQVHRYIMEYLAVTQQEDKLRVSLCPILTKVSREDAAPTLSVFDLEAVLLDVKNSNDDPFQPQHIMLIQYEASIAHMS